MSLIDVEVLIVVEYLIWVIKCMCDWVLVGMSGYFDEIYVGDGVFLIFLEMLFKGKVL